jgi:hypothetical protein
VSLFGLFNGGIGGVYHGFQLENKYDREKNSKHETHKFHPKFNFVLIMLPLLIFGAIFIYGGGKTRFGKTSESIHKGFYICLIGLAGLGASAIAALVAIIVSMI